MRRLLPVSITTFLFLFLLVGCGEEVPTAPESASGPFLGRAGSNVSLVVGGVGLFSQPAGFNLDVPAGDASDILEASFYWSGRSFSSTPDPTIVINGTEYTGDLSSTYPVNGGYRTAFFYKLDAIAAGLVAPGTNSYTISGFDHGAGGLTDGIGLAVIYADDSSEYSEILTIEPNEFVYYDDPDYPQGLVHSFSFAPSAEARQGTWVTFVGDCKDFRPDAIWYDAGAGSPPANMIGGSFDHVDDEFVSANGDEFDIFELTNIPIAVGDDYFAYQLESPPAGNGDSMMHTFSAFCVPAPPQGETGCRVTGGGVDSYGHWDGTYANGKSGRGGSVNRYTFGGQAGAPTGALPQPYGEWTHHQQRGPAGSFVFHAGTSSAPEGTEIALIECSDPGWCVQARPAPAKQIDFEGVGTFRTINSDAPELEGAVAGVTRHWFEVHIEDLGEPGRNGHQPNPGGNCPEEGSAGTEADCGCPDFYWITIYAGVAPGDIPNQTDVIYEVYGYIDGGNLQIHPPLD